MSISSKYIFLSGASMIIAAAPSALHAQTAAPAATTAPAETATTIAAPLDLPSDEIVVTATRRTESLKDVPMSVDVVTGTQIKKLNLFDAKDVQQLSPGLQLTNTAGRNNVATLRGVTFDPDSGATPAVDIYYNEVPVDAQTIFSAIYDVGQIEVLRGPQGSLRGRTAPAGAITIASKKPDLSNITGYLQGTGTTRHAYNAQGAVSLPLVEGKLAMRAALLVDTNRLNQVYNVSRGEHSSSQTLSGRLSLAWAPSSDLRVDVSYQYLQSDDHQYNQVLGPGNAPAQFDPTVSGPPASVKDYIAVQEGLQRFQNRTHLLTGSLAWTIGKQTLSFVGGYQNTLLHQAQDTDAGNAVPGYIQQQHVRTPYPVTTAELRLDSQYSGFWNYSLDAFYSRQTGVVTVTTPSYQFFDNFPYSFGAYLPVDAALIIPSNVRSMSVAASSRFQFTNKLRLEVAARYSWYRTIFSSLLATSSPGFPSADPQQNIPPFSTPYTETVQPNNRRQAPKALTGSANLTYTFSPAVTAYLSYGRSFRPAAVDSAVPAPLNNDLIIGKDETSDSFEAGIKTSLLDRRVTFNASIFYQKFKNYIARTPNSIYYVANDGETGFTQLNFNGDADVKGIETTLSGKVSDNLDLSMSASYTKARYKNALAPCNDYNGDGIPDATGTPSVSGANNVSFCSRNDRLADVPNFSLISSGEYHFDTGNVQPFIRYLLNYRPKVHSIQADFTYQSRTNLNLYTGLRGPDDKWELTAFVKNLLNQRRITNIGLGTAQIATFGSPYNSGYSLINSTVPREFGATLQFNF